MVALFSVVRTLTQGASLEPEPEAEDTGHQSSAAEKLVYPYFTRVHVMSAVEPTADGAGRDASKDVLVQCRDGSSDKGG
jgi:hypothetical protein